MKKQFISIFLIFSILVFGCTNNENDTNKEVTGIFQNYLEETFHSKIPMKEHYYFLVPSSQCRGCNFYDGRQIDSALNGKLTIISTFPSTNFQHFRHLWEDTSKKLLNLAFVNYTNKLIVTKDGEIKSISMVNDFYKQLDSLNQYYSK